MALPPNFIHSLDSSHMLMTASACRDAGIVFASVHDSYWAHACDVDQMNSILREQFVKLHSPNLLGKLLEQWTEKYSCIKGEVYISYYTYVHLHIYVRRRPDELHPARAVCQAALAELIGNAARTAD